MTSKCLSIICLTVNLFVIIPTRASVVLYRKEFADQPGSKYTELKCDFDLTVQDYHVEKVIISKEDKPFYSVEYAYENNTVDLVNPDLHAEHGRIHGVSKVTELKNEGWTAIGVKNHDPGSYKCLVFYSKPGFSDNETILIQESDNVDLVKEGEKVKLKIDHKSVHMGDNVKLGCQYNLLSNDSFYGLSLFKDNQEFFKYYNDKNHTFEPINGVHNISWSSHARAIYMTVKKAVNSTGGMYGCSLNYSNSHIEDKYLTVTDESKLEFRSSANRVGVVFLWLTISLFIIFY